LSSATRLSLVPSAETEKRSKGRRIKLPHGAWVHLRDRTFAWTTLDLVSDLDQNLLCTVKARGEYTVDESGNKYKGRFQAEAVDPDGNLIFSIEGTNKGERIVVERLR
jgi:hypothetical protein